MNQSTVGTFVSWLAFVFLIISGLELSLRYSKKIKTMREVGFIESQLIQGVMYPIRLGIWLLLAVLVLYSKPFSIEWTIIVAISFILILIVAWRRLIIKDIK